MSYVAFQYAEALFSLALESKQLDSLQEVYDGFLEAQDSDIHIFLNHPKIKKSEKKEVLKNAIEHPLFIHFLYVLIDNNRVDLLDDVYRELQTIINNQHKVMYATVYSRVALTKTELENLQTSIGKKHQRTVTLENVVDPSIIGGVRIEYEGHVLDQTINNYLHSLQNDLSK
ncbi:ATP synthase F1 subunit delta [Candidatus Xianfuyuplasma coldseepsis]|uniref:ATP synthase subunit delta n=1 Tax=Candidatus Xianfuyuplasma coldseepsis TaxID=2782163 RepID=A0A7L7KS49_9MOLU|nr:ATP synthase F1 subunit delta [Xianfuyuplasma coldseepsis]QMS85425.1 ATP synthase F1 subunit delta [Xianfuyuplasma coldseepsis]